MTDPISNVVYDRIDLSPSLQGFELVVNVSAYYTSAGVSNSSPILSDFADNCLDVDPPDYHRYGTNSYEVNPLETHLTVSGTTVTGYLIYPAVIAGSYSFDQGCAGAGGQAYLGDVTTPTLGNSPGSYNGNGLDVFAERTSATDTVILFGAFGQSGDSQRAVRQSCIVASYTDPSYPSSTTYFTQSPSSIYFVQQESEGSEWYDVGIIIFKLSASEVAGGEFYYDCTQDGVDYVKLN